MAPVNFMTLVNFLTLVNFMTLYIFFFVVCSDINPLSLQMWQITFSFHLPNYNFSCKKRLDLAKSFARVVHASCISGGYVMSFSLLQLHTHTQFQFVVKAMQMKTFFWFFLTS